MRVRSISMSMRNQMASPSTLIRTSGIKKAAVASCYGGEVQWRLDGDKLWWPELIPALLLIPKLRSRMHHTERDCGRPWTPDHRRPTGRCALCGLSFRESDDELQGYLPSEA